MHERNPQQCVRRVVVVRREVAEVSDERIEHLHFDPADGKEWAQADNHFAGALSWRRPSPGGPGHCVGAARSFHASRLGTLATLLGCNFPEPPPGHVKCFENFQALSFWSAPLNDPMLTPVTTSIFKQHNHPILMVCLDRFTGGDWRIHEFRYER